VNEHLVEAVLGAASFFEFSGDEDCDPDLAVKQLEAIADGLRQMSAAEQDEFRRFAYRSADAHPSGADLRQLVDALLPLADG